MISNVQAFMNRVALLDDAHTELSKILEDMSNDELCALAHDWEDWWARPEQLPPEGPWRSWGMLTGRGWGKNRAIAELVHREAISGRAMRIGLCSQGEVETIRDLVLGESGVIAVSPPWEKAVWEAGRVLWPNGAQAFIYTPHEPDNCFGPEHHLVWCSEIHAWPKTKMERAFQNLRMGCRIGYGRMVWDSNPRRRHPILRFLLARGERSPDRHIVVRGTTFDNIDNLAPEVVAEWVEDYGGTQRGQEMLEGKQIDEEEGAIVEQSWIDRHRATLPALKRRIIAVDPSISERKGTDATGIVELGLTNDDRIGVIANHSGKHSWDVWGKLVVELYEQGRCDCVVVERNRGGDACVGNLRAAAQSPDRVKAGKTLAVVVVKADADTRYTPGVIFVKEVIGRDGKFERAEPCSSLYENGKVFHVIGADLETLEETLTTWVPEPGAQSPNDLDAVVWGIWELAGLGREAKKLATGSCKGLGEIAKEIAKPQQTRTLASVLNSRGRRGL